MQLSALPHRRGQAPAFLNHTPRAFETPAPPPPPPPQVPGPVAAEMPFSAGPAYTNALMGSIPSAQQREAARKASSNILREDSIQVELEGGSVANEPASRPDSWSMHHDCTDQRPYSARSGDTVITQTSALKLPERNTDSAELAYFFRHTGPKAPHRRPSKLESSAKKAVGPSKSALRLFRFGQRRAPTAVASAHCELDEVFLRDEGNLLHPDGVEPKETSTGKRYLALKVKTTHDAEVEMQNTDYVPHLSPEIVDSRVSVLFSDDSQDDWLYAANPERLWRRTSASSRQPSVVLGAVADNTVRMIQSSSPIRPAASNPPTPQPYSAPSIAESYQLDLNDHPAKQFDTTRALSSHPVQGKRSASSPMLTIPLPYEEFPVRIPSAKRDVHIAHPSPRRFVSHPVLLQRASSIASSMYPRSFCDSPGPPPPKSPLRLRQDPRSIGAVIHPSPSEACKKTPIIAPSISIISEHIMDREATPVIIPSVVTECTGPIKRPKSSIIHTTKHPLYLASRKEREDKTRQRKLRDRPTARRTIDSLVQPEPMLSGRLRKARPQIQIPSLKPAPLKTPDPLSASSTASWRKITESTLTPVSSVPSHEELPASNEEKTGYTPISPTTSESSPGSATICLSPVMLVAEEVPVPKVKSPATKPARLILHGEGSKYAPRPRSASMALKHRSRPGSIAGMSRPSTPRGSKSKADTPPLPSPPPNRALPPTPPASGSERVLRPAKGSKVHAAPTDGGSKKSLPIPPSYEILPPAPLNIHRHHVSTQMQSGTRSQAQSARDDRLEMLEKQNALLSAALMAVLRTNGALNSPLTELGDALLDGSRTPTGPMAWENRVARRSQASGASRVSHAKTGSDGSALEMYMSTRGSMSAV